MAVISVAAAIGEGTIHRDNPVGRPEFASESPYPHHRASGEPVQQMPLQG
jgi:hypothetical protein